MTSGDFGNEAPIGHVAEYPYDAIAYTGRVLKHHEYMEKLDASIAELTAIADDRHRDPQPHRFAGEPL